MNDEICINCKHWNEWTPDSERGDCKVFPWMKFGGTNTTATDECPLFDKRSDDDPSR